MNTIESRKAAYKAEAEEIKKTTFEVKGRVIDEFEDVMDKYMSTCLFQYESNIANCNDYSEINMAAMEFKHRMCYLIAVVEDIPIQLDQMLTNKLRNQQHSQATNDQKPLYSAPPSVVPHPGDSSSSFPLLTMPAITPITPPAAVTPEISKSEDVFDLETMLKHVSLYYSDADQLHTSTSTTRSVDSQHTENTSSNGVNANNFDHSPPEPKSQKPVRIRRGPVASAAVRKQPLPLPHPETCTTMKLSSFSGPGKKQVAVTHIQPDGWFYVQKKATVPVFKKLHNNIYKFMSNNRGMATLQSSQLPCYAIVYSVALRAFFRAHLSRSSNWSDPTKEVCIIAEISDFSQLSKRKNSGHLCIFV